MQVTSSRESQISVKTKRPQKLVEQSFGTWENFLNYGIMVSQDKAGGFGFRRERESWVKDKEACSIVQTMVR